MSGAGEDRTVAIGDGKKEVVRNFITAGKFKILKRLIIVVNSEIK